MTITTGPKPHALYRLYGADDVLLYVGITLDLPGRWKKHSELKPWWTDVVRTTVEHYPDRESVLLAEKVAIAAEHPRFNIQHQVGKATGQPRVMFFEPDWGVEPGDMPDLCHDYCAKFGISEMYYPYRWVKGFAHYRCIKGHHWTCGWGHNYTGDAPAMAATPQMS